MNSQIAEGLRQTTSLLVSKSMRLEARCDAIEIVLGVLARKLEIPDAQIEKMLTDVTALSYQRRLERVESVDPAIAAELDRRPIMPELPDESDDSPAPPA